MSKGFRDLSALLQGLNTKKTRENYDLPNDYVISKFFELGFNPQYNRVNNTYQCSCPICREGKSFGKKKRCYYLPFSNKIYCHNCGWKSSPYFWIKEVSKMTEQEIFDEASDGGYDYVDVEKLSKPEEEELINIPSLPEDCINLYDILQVNYFYKEAVVAEADKYLRKRKLYTAINKPKALYLSLKDFYHKNRIVIPFRNEDGDIIFYQSRSFLDWDTDSESYISKVNSDKSLFGIENVDYKNGSEIFIFEGPIDSMFVKNGVALGGISGEVAQLTPLQKAQIQALIGFTHIWCLDSQWIDKTAYEASMTLLERGESVFIWPKKYGKDHKDLNELCVKKNLNGISGEFIKKNTFRGLEGVLKLKSMR